MSTSNRNLSSIYKFNRTNKQKIKKIVLILNLIQTLEVINLHNEVSTNVTIQNDTKKCRPPFSTNQYVENLNLYLDLK